MLTPPDVSTGLILSRVNQEYDLGISQITFLPLGADSNTAVYRAVTSTGAPYFLKLRKNTFDPITVEVPAYLHAQGIRSIIPPLPARSGTLWAWLDPFALICYPYIEGKDGYQVALTPEQWQGFGADLARVHATQLPAALAARIPREEYSPRIRDMVRGFLAMVEAEVFAEPVAAQLAAFLRARHAVITHMLDRADALAQALLTHPREFVLCHSDLHAGNLHLTPGGAFYVVDWDAPLYAPRERDLLLVGGARPWDGAAVTGLFYSGYAPAQGSVLLDPQALAYYRYTRILDDIADFSRQLLLSSAGGEDREQSYGFCTGQFQPGCEVDVALQTDSNIDTTLQNFA